MALINKENGWLRYQPKRDAFEHRWTDHLAPGKIGWNRVIALALSPRNGRELFISEAAMTDDSTLTPPRPGDR